MDHFAGFDRLLRVCLHRPTPLHLVGPTGFADHVEHKLKAYTLNLLDAQSVDFAIVANEFNGSGFDRVCEFRAREAVCRRRMLDRGNPGTDAEQWGKYRNQFASPSIAHSQGAGSRCWILAVDGPQSNPDSWSIDLRCY